MLCLFVNIMFYCFLFITLYLFKQKTHSNENDTKKLRETFKTSKKVNRPIN